MITSARNPQIAQLRRLGRARERSATGLTTVEGPFLLDEAVAAGVGIRAVLAVPGDGVAGELADRAAIDVTIVSPEVLKTVANSLHPRGPVTVIEIPAVPEIEPLDSIVLWKVSDPGNAGTIIRSAAAFGFQVLAIEGTADLWAPKVVRAAAGGHFRSPPIERLAPDPSQLTEVGLRPLLTVAHGGRSVEDLVQDPEPVAIIVGNEAHGVSDDLEIFAGVDSMSLAMPGGLESLNAGVAAAIVMYLRCNGRQ